MATLVGITNRALAFLGHNPINSMNQGVEAARRANLLMQATIDSTLRAYNWNRATKRASLARSADSPAFEFSYQFALPNDCLRVIRMSDRRIKFQIEGRYLLTDEETALIKYICRISVGDMDPLLEDVVAARLAMDLAFPLTNSKSMLESMGALYLAKKTEAVQIDAQEGFPDEDDEEPEGLWLSVRR